MAITLVQQFSNTNSVSSQISVLVTVPQAIPAGSKLIVLVGENQIIPVTVSDPRGNTYTQDVFSTTSSGNNTVIIISCDVVTTIQAGDSITATFAESGFSRKMIHVREFTGLMVGAALDRTGTATASPSTAMDVPLSAATTQANELILGAFAVNHALNPAAEFTADSPWIEGTEVEILGSGGRAIYSAHQNVSSIATYSFGGDLDVTPGGNWAGAIASYRQAAGVTSLAVPLATFLDPVNNFAFGVFFRDLNASMDPDSGFFELADFGMATPPMRVEVQQRTGEDLSISATDSGSDEGSSWIGIAAEFRAATAVADKAIVPTGVSGSSAVTATVTEDAFKAVALRSAVGPFLIYFQRPATLRSRSVVSASIISVPVSGSVQSVTPNPGGIQGRSTVSGTLIVIFAGGQNVQIIPSTVDGESRVTGEVVGPLPLIDFTPETGAAPALIPSDDLLPGATTIPGSFDFRVLGDD